MMKCLKVKDLKEVLNQFDDELYLIVTKDGKGHSFPIVMEYIEETTNAYDPNSDFDAEMENSGKYLRLALV
jgi:hypothetical protein